MTGKPESKRDTLPPGPPMRPTEALHEAYEAASSAYASALLAAGLIKAARDLGGDIEGIEHSRCRAIANEAHDLMRELHEAHERNRGQS